MEDLETGCNDLSFKDPGEFLHDPEGYARHVIGRIPTMSMKDLDLTARQALKIEGISFLIRAFCVARMVELKTPQTGGRGKKDQAVDGINATLRLLAEDWRFKMRTLQTDLAIYREFFAAPPETSATVALVYDLERGYYSAALSAQDPRAALEMAIKKRQEGNYPVSQFDRDLERKGMKVRKGARKSGQAVNVGLEPQVAQRLETQRESMRSEYPEECATLAQFVNFFISQKLTCEIQETLTPTPSPKRRRSNVSSSSPQAERMER